MKFKKIYDELKEAIGHEKLLNDLLLKLEELTRKESAKESGGGELLRYNTAKKILKGFTNKSRPILQKSIIRDNKQIFTDSYQLYVLKNHIIGLEAHDSETIKNYPTIDRIIPETHKTLDLNIKELKKDMSVLSKNEMLHIKNEDLHASLDPNMIKNVIKILQLKNNDTLKLGYVENINSYQEPYLRPFKIELNDDVVIIMPYKFEVEEEKNENK